MMTTRWVRVTVVTVVALAIVGTLCLEGAYRLALASLQPLSSLGHPAPLDPRVARAIWAAETGKADHESSREETKFAKAIARDFLWVAHKRGQVSIGLDFFLKDYAVREWIARNMTTDEIMARYAGLMWVGPSERGLEAGAQYWYCKHAADLEDVQLALLLGVSQSAALFEALRHPEGAVALRNHVLDRFVAAKYMPSAALAAAKAAPLDVSYPCPCSAVPN
jgi:transglycosylase-like protein